MEKMYVCLFLIAAVGCTLTGPVVAMDHIVGGSLGWTNSPNITYYHDWVQPRTFGVGDKLVFPFRTGVHNVLEVSKEDFDACTQKKVVEMYYKGPLVLELTEPGEHYYYCGVGTHCEGGTKIAIAVVNGPGSSGHQFKLSNESAVPPAPSSGASVHKFGVAAGLVALMVSLLI